MIRFFYALILFVLCSWLPATTIAQDTLKTKSDSSLVIPDTLLFKIQKAQSAITEINAANKKGYDIKELTDRLQEIKDNTLPIQRDFNRSGNNLETKSLQSYGLILRDAQVQLNSLTAILSKHNNDLQRLSQMVVDLSGDTLLTITNADEAQKKLYRAQVNEIKGRLQDAGKLTNVHLEEVSKLLAEVSAMTITVNDLRDKADELMERSGKMALTRQEAYLWNAPLIDHSGSSIKQEMFSSYKGQEQILKYFINSTWDKRFLAFLLAIAFFIWVHSNFKLSARAAVKRKIGVLEFEYLKPLPVLATLIVLLNLTPLFEPDSPSIYIELIQLLLLILMTIHLRKTLPRREMQYWLILTVSYALLVLGSSAVTAAFPLRMGLIMINLFFIYLGIMMFRKMKIKQLSRRYIKMVMVVLVSFNILAIILNLLGRVILAKALTLTGVIGLTQMIGLAVFIQIMLDALELQIKLSSCNKGIFSRINHNKARVKSKKALSVLAVILWIMVFLINLSLTAGVAQFTEQVLSKQRTFGSIHFTIGNILFFVAIIYIANKLQKHVPLLFGEETVTFDGRTEHKGSKVALVRLIIIIVGVLFAVTASGLPADRLTVVLGALGVGIGLGLQNIVNNFVSGIILIFEKPFRVGDYVELADKKGKVQDIGIRSSKLLTPQGSEVIIPNGDLLSGRLVNWTLSNDFAKTELIFKISNQADIDLVQKIILEEIESMSGIIKNLQPEILVNNILLDSMEIKVLAWVHSVYTEAGFKSELLKRLLSRFNKEQIKMM